MADGDRSLGRIHCQVSVGRSVLIEIGIARARRAKLNLRARTWRVNEPEKQSSRALVTMMDPSLENGALGFIGIESFFIEIAHSPRIRPEKNTSRDFSVNCLNGDINDNFLGRFNYFSFSLALSLSPGHRQLHNFSAANPKSFVL